MATLYEQMQSFNVGDVHLKPSRGHVYIRQPVTPDGLWKLLTSLYGQMQNVNVAAMVIFMKLSREHVQIRQVVTTGTFDFLI